MNFHSHSIPDRRRRFYLPMQKVLLHHQVENPLVVTDNQEYQSVIHYCKEMMTIHPGGRIILDIGKSIHGGIRLTYCDGPCRLRVKFGESVSEAVNTPDPDSSCREAVLETSNFGMLEYGNTVFRFVQIENIGKVPFVCQNIIAVALECDCIVTGAFESSDKLLNDIWKTAVRTVHLCMQDYIYDGSKRDRIVWMGDLHPEVKGICCAFSDTAIVRDTLEFIIRQTPCGEPMNGFYTYSCWFIITLWDYLCISSDDRFVREHAEYIQTVLRKWSTYVDADGKCIMPEPLFLDWPNENHPQAKSAGIHALLYWMITCGIKLLNYLGKDTSFLHTAQRKLGSNIPVSAGRKAPAALLTLTGLSDCRNILETDPFAGVSTFYGYYMLLAKETVAAQKLIRRYWGGMLELGASSFWEDFDLAWMENAGRIDEIPVSGKRDIHLECGAYCYKGLRHSLSHGWSCGPAPFLSERCLGVSFPEPGKVIVKPDLGDLQELHGQVPTPLGIITVEADCRGRKNIVIPDGLILVKE